LASTRSTRVKWCPPLYQYGDNYNE
jgi:hypothetical protein